jgi:hypothetical protein
MGVRTQKQIKHKDRLALFDLKIKSEVTDLLRTLSLEPLAFSISEFRHLQSESRIRMRQLFLDDLRIAKSRIKI